MTGWLDLLPRLWRHLLIQLMACLLAWATSDLIPALHDQQGYAAVAGALLSQILLILTPLIRSYGISWASAEPDQGRHEQV